MIGTETGKVIGYSTRSKICRVCDFASSTGKEPRKHECRQNWNGSSKSIEADMVVELVKSVHGRSVGSGPVYVDAIVGDEDATTVPLQEVSEKIGMSPGKHGLSRAAVLDCQERKRHAMSKSRSAKKRRIELKANKYSRKTGIA